MEKIENVKNFFKNFELNEVCLGTSFASASFDFKDSDRDAAWEMYIELLTRITTQGLAPKTGDEKAALSSIYQIFPITREILKLHGRKTIEFSKVAIVVLNQIIRPFTAKWHRRLENNQLESEKDCKEFREELKHLQQQLLKYTRMLAVIADVEDLTKINNLK